jgi:hypothetical protein
LRFSWAVVPPLYLQHPCRAALQGPARGHSEAGVQLALLEAEAARAAGRKPLQTRSILEEKHMTLFRSRSPAALSAALLSSWAALGQAQQPPGTNVPTPSPVPEASPAVSAPVAPVLQEPVIDPKTSSSSIPNTPLLVTGLVVLGGSYGASALYSGLSDRDSDDKLYYPVAGPWMALKDRDCNAEPCDNETLGTAALIGSGVLQGLGALSIVLSLVIPEKTTHNWYLIGQEHEQNLAVVPLMSGDQLGAFAVGRF